MRTVGQGSLRRMAGLAAVICWLAAVLGAAKAVWLRSFHGPGWNLAVSGWVVAWMVTSQWAAYRRHMGETEKVGRSDASLQRVLTQIATAVEAMERLLFFWTPLLGAVLWSLYGVHFAPPGAIWRRTDSSFAATMYFMLAMFPTLIWLKWMAEVRRHGHWPPAG